MKLKFIVTLLMLALPALAQQHIDLSGEWKFRSERETGVVRLPGSMLTNGKGDEVTVNTKWTSSLYDSSYYFNPYMARYRQAGQMKFPFFLTPDKHYVGNAWYERTVMVPKRWKGKPVMLYLERPHIETTVLVNGQRVGHQQSLSAPHVYNITPYIIYGKPNQLTIQVYNGIENVCVGQDSHSVTDQTQGNWNGIVGKIELRQGPNIWRKRVVPDMQNGIVTITINETNYRLPLGKDTMRWDEFHPQLYTRTVKYQGMPVSVTFGLRELRVDGARMLINNRPMYLRGTVGNCCFPETGYPPTDEASWERVLGQCKAWGINHIRFHSYCPPEAAFAVADRLGLYLQPEGPSWPNHGVKLRNGMAIDQYLIDEGKRMIDEYGHHPSFCMMAAGNEPAGNWVSYCNEWVQQMKAYDPTRLYCGASVGGGWAWDDGSEYHVKAGARGLDWDRHAPHSDDDYYQQLLYPRNYKAKEPNNSPIIAHEQGQWCAFPDFRRYHNIRVLTKPRTLRYSAICFLITVWPVRLRTSCRPAVSCRHSVINTRLSATCVPRIMPVSNC